MNWLKALSENKNIHTTLFDFLDQYGMAGLEEALQLYQNNHQKYIYRTKKFVA